LALAQHGVELGGIVHDTFLYAALLDATDSRQDLATVAERRLGFRPAKRSPEEEADIAGQLEALLSPEMQRSELEKVYAELELPVAEILARMESAGILIDA